MKRKPNHLLTRTRITLFAVCALLYLSISAPAQQPADTTRSSGSDRELQGYAVAPFSTTLFVLYNRAGSFPAQERAAAVTRRIRKLGDNYYFKKDSLQLMPQENSIDIVYGDNIIVNLSGEDARLMKVSLPELAGKYRLQIAESVAAHREAVSATAMLKRTGLALLVAAFIISAIYFINRLFRLIQKRIGRQEGKSLNGIRYRRYILLSAGHHTRLLLAITKLVKLAITVLLLFFTIPLLFGIFPQTERLAGRLLELITTPAKTILQSIWLYLPRLVTIFIIIAAFYLLLKGLRFVKRELEKGVLKFPGFHTDWANPTYQIMRVLIYALVLVLIFPYLPGSGSPVFNGVTIFLGALLTFGSSTSLGNIVSGLALTYMRSFKDGDRVKIGNITGDIVEKNLLVTRIRTIKNEVISIPNSNVLNEHAINFSKDAPDRGLILHTTITIGYDVPWQTVHELTTQAALATRLVETDPPPFIYQTSLDDFYVSYQVNVYTKHSNHQASIYSELHQHIMDHFNRAGIEMLSPHYRALRDGNTTAMPAANLPAGYEAPSLRVAMAGPDNE